MNENNDPLNDQLFKNMIQNNWVAVVFASMDNIVKYVNPAACELYGYHDYELIGQTTDIFNSHLSHDTDAIIASIKDKGYWSGEIIQRRKDDSTFSALLSVQLIFDESGNPVGFASNSKDITNDLETEKKLKKTIQEKKLLLRELHHRVKNNLSIIKGIISLQNHQDLEESSKKIIDDFKNRIDAVATLHNTLYDPENLNSLDLKSFINDLCAGLNRSYSEIGKEIKILNEMDHYALDISKATPLCLIINEVITNAYKHAFTNSKTGVIKVSLSSEGHYIRISDTGPGFDLDSVNEKTLGMSLIKALSEQIDANFEFENVNGTIFTISLN